MFNVSINQNEMTGGSLIQEKNFGLQIKRSTTGESLINTKNAVNGN